MALVNRSFSVNVTPGMMPPIAHVSEYDVGRAYTVSILDEQGNTFAIPTGTTASIEGTLNGSVGFTQSATISNNQITFALTESMTAYAGKAWCKIKLTLNSEPIQTCAFILAVDRAGVEADTVIGAPGFQEQINKGVAEYFDNDPPFFELPSGGQSGQALLSDGHDGAVWGEAGIPEAVKAALLDCFENVAWVNDQGQTYYNALYSALYQTEPPTPPAQIIPDISVGEVVTGYYYDENGLEVANSYGRLKRNYFEVTPNKTYYWKDFSVPVSGTDGGAARVLFYDSNYTFIRRVSGSGIWYPVFEFTTPSNARYIRLSWGDGNNVGTIVSERQPYHSLSIALAKPDNSVIANVNEVSSAVSLWRGNSEIVLDADFALGVFNFAAGADYTGRTESTTRICNTKQILLFAGDTLKFSSVNYGVSVKNLVTNEVDHSAAWVTDQADYVIGG